MYEIEFKNITNKALELGPPLDKFRDKVTLCTKEAQKVNEFVVENYENTVK